MITYEVSRLLYPLGVVNKVIGEVQAAIANREANFKLNRPIYERLMVVRMMCQELSPHVIERIERVLGLIQNPPVNAPILLHQLVALGETLHFELNRQSIYHYPEALAKTLKDHEKDWAAAITSFKSAKPDITSGVDCHCMGQPTAAVFHFMRAAEIGMRALASERRIKLKSHGKAKPIEYAEWSEILRELRKAQADIESGPTAWSAGPRKDAALDFYGSAIAGLTHFKDRYRNPVSHSRRTYEPEDSAKVMRQVRDFMNDIALRVSDQTRGPIRKWV